VSAPRPDRADEGEPAPSSAQRNEANFRVVIESSPDALAVYQHNAVRYVNRKMLLLLGYASAEELLGRSVIDFVHPEDRALVGERMASYAARSLVSPPAEERLLRKDGGPVPVEVTTIPIFWDDAPATLVHARDLTENNRLRAQLVMADRLASVGRLAAAVGHEINNPLAYVMANLDLALERLTEIGAPVSMGPQAAPNPGSPAAPLNDDRLVDVVEMLREAREGADRVRHIVRDLKVFSRGETEERGRVDPRRVLDSCVNIARAEIRPRARLVKRYEDTPPVVANEARLGQVLLNLLVNAAHAIPEGDPNANEITVATRGDAHGHVVIEVADTGAGIPDDVKKHIFEPFFTTKAGGLGTGLGLSIAQSVVSALGGEITFESQLGHGSTFRVILPAADPDGPATRPPSSHPPTKRSR
jgi:PAS domain S-box-containing protein